MALVMFQNDPSGFPEDTGNDQLVTDLFTNFDSPDDPTFLSSPENDYSFTITPPSTLSPPIAQDIDYSSISPPGPPIPSSELYPRLGNSNKKHKGLNIDIERWTPYHPTTRQYFGLFDGNQQEIGSVVEVWTKIDKVDKREHYSPADEAYILYRQNQFQLDIDMLGNLQNYSSSPPTPTPTATPSPQPPMFVDLGGSYAPVECLYYHIYAVKQHKSNPLGPMEDQESLVDLVQLGGPRNRKDFQLPGLSPIVLGRSTYSRLQFRAATPNNARVHPDQPNPNQQYYRIVLSLVAKTANSLNFIFSKISPCLMVRGQNPGKFQGHTSSSAPLSRPLSPTEPKQEYPQPTPPLYLTAPPPPPSPYMSSSSPPSLYPQDLNKPLPPLPPPISSSSSSYPLPPPSPFNPNPSQLPSISPPTPGSGRGIKRHNSSQPLMPDKGGGGGGGEGWVKDSYSGNVYAVGKVGINTTNPQEALSVQGNILVTGDVLKPSDERIKMNITPITTTSQLDTIEKVRLYDYDLKANGPHGAQMHERGVLAQELQRVLPSAVRVLNNVTLSDGTVMPELLVVQDRALLFENIGATQELSHKVKQQNTRVNALSQRLSRHMHEVGETTKRMAYAMGGMMGFMLTEKKIDYENSCFFLSIFGLGPAWTMYILGFFLPFMWFFGLFYIASAVSVKKTAGVTHFVTLVVYVVYIGLIFGWPDPLSLKEQMIALSLPAALGIIVNITFFLYWRRKQNEKDMALRQGLARGYAEVQEVQEMQSLARRSSSASLQSYGPTEDSSV